ncbi:MAG: endonuclease IV, partial [Eubacteriaceae bacterium]|nr:endonuclease IV [Eubacteriaceae bacterium]
MHIGCHLSSSKGYLAMGQEALRIGADTFSFFTRNPRGGSAKAADIPDMLSLRELLEKEGFAPLVAHAPYTYNLCSDRESNRQFAERSMREDLERL